MSFFGGMLIGLSAVLLMAFHGRIAGMTGILSGLLAPISSDWAWRAAFVVGAVAAAAILQQFAGNAITFHNPVPTFAVVLSGLVVGIGVYFGSGCTSGHGICGMARLSPRSIAATLTFMVGAFLSVFVIRHVMGGF